MSKPHWNPEQPTKPGRYFYREPESGYYGVCLVAWSRGMVHGGYVKQPELQVQATCIMGQGDGRHGFGENCSHPNWSYGGGVDKAEFWTEPLATPDFPEISGRPPDVAPEAIKKEKIKISIQAKANKQREHQQAEARKVAIKLAVEESTDLYECDGCSSLLTPHGLVTGKLRECPHCCTEFVEVDGRNCPDCNRPFTRLIDEKQTCPDCLDGGELSELTLIVQGGAVQ